MKLLDVYRRNYVGRGSSVGIVTRYGLEGPGIESRWRDEIFRTCPDRPWGSPSFLYHGYRVFPPRVKRLRDGFDHPPLSSAKVTERTELYPCSPSELSWLILGWPLPLSFTEEIIFSLNFKGSFYFLLNWMFVKYVHIKSEGLFCLNGWGQKCDRTMKLEAIRWKVEGQQTVTS